MVFDSVVLYLYALLTTHYLLLTPMDQLLTQLGLTGGEAAVYQSLLERESGSPAELATVTGLKRPDTYNKLAELRAKGLIEEFTAPNGRKRYRLEHPQKLQEYIETRERELHTVERELDAALPDLISRYQLAGSKPGVSYFEGKEGMERVLDDILTTHELVYAYVDSEAAEKYADDVDRRHVAKRAKLGIKKRLIVTDNEFNRRYFTNLRSELTEVRYLPGVLVSLNAAMHIYDNKVSYVTMRSDLILGMIVQSPAITQLQRTLFEFNWSVAHSYDQAA